MCNGGSGWGVSCTTTSGACEYQCGNNCNIGGPGRCISGSSTHCFPEASPVCPKGCTANLQLVSSNVEASINNCELSSLVDLQGCCVQTLQVTQTGNYFAVVPSTSGCTNNCVSLQGILNSVTPVSAFVFLLNRQQGSAFFALAVQNSGVVTLQRGDCELVYKVTSGSVPFLTPGNSPTSPPSGCEAATAASSAAAVALLGNYLVV